MGVREEVGVVQACRLECIHGEGDRVKGHWVLVPRIKVSKTEKCT